jgi:hypothetical protein
MATPTTREELKQYALRKLGAPVIEINVDDAQLEDSLDDAIQIFNEYHFDGVERALFKHEITQTDIDNGFIDTNSLGLTGPNDYPQVEDSTRIVSITKAFQFDEGGAGTNMFSVRYQMALNDSYGLRYGGDMTNYYITQSYISLLADFLDPEKQIRFNRVTNRVYLDMNWSETVSAGDFVVLDCYVSLNPDNYTEIYNDILLKRYVTASFRKQWGMNLVKYQGINLPGGVQFDGQALISQGNDEMEKIEDTLQDKYELPPDFFTG